MSHQQHQSQTCKICVLIRKLASADTSAVAPGPTHLSLAGMEGAGLQGGAPGVLEPVARLQGLARQPEQGLL